MKFWIFFILFILSISGTYIFGRLANKILNGTSTGDIGFMLMYGFSSIIFLIFTIIFATCSIVFLFN